MQTVHAYKESMIQLIVRLQGTLVETVDLEKQPAIILGRHTSNHVRLAKQTVSKQHARILTHEGQSYLEDLNSTNGTWVNNRRIRVCKLRSGDVVTIGKFQLEYLCTDEHLPSAQTKKTEASRAKVIPIKPNLRSEE